MAIEADGQSFGSMGSIGLLPLVGLAKPFSCFSRPVRSGASVKCDGGWNTCCHLLPFTPSQLSKFPDMSMAYVGTCCHSLPVAIKPKVARLYLNQEAQELLSASSAEIGDLSESQIMSLLVLAALRALQQENFRMVMPLRLSVVKEESSLFVPSCR